MRGPGGGSAGVAGHVPDRPERGNPPHQPSGAAAGSSAAEATLCLYRRGDTTTTVGGSNIPVPEGNAPSLQPLHDGGARVLRGITARGDHRFNGGRCASRRRYDRDPGHEVLQVASPPTYPECDDSSETLSCCAPRIRSAGESREWLVLA